MRKIIICALVLALALCAPVALAESVTVNVKVGQTLSIARYCPFDCSFQYPSNNIITLNKSALTVTGVNVGEVRITAANNMVTNTITVKVVAADAPTQNQSMYFSSKVERSLIAPFTGGMNLAFATATLNMRDDAGNVIGAVLQGALCEPLDSSGSRMRVRNDKGQVGTVTMSSLKLFGDFLDMKVVKADALNLRSGPSSSYSIIGTLRQNDIVPVIATSDKWLLVLNEGKVGYAYSEYLNDAPFARNSRGFSQSPNQGEQFDDCKVQKCWDGGFALYLVIKPNKAVNYYSLSPHTVINPDGAYAFKDARGSAYQNTVPIYYGTALYLDKNFPNELVYAYRDMLIGEGYIDINDVREIVN